MAAIIASLPTTMEYIGFFNTQLTGTIPAEISGFTNLTTLELTFNQVSGDLSTIIGYLPSSMQEIIFKNNNFTGTIPGSVSKFSALSKLDLTNNQLDGDITTIFSDLPVAINQLHLSNNSFTGTVPSEASSLSNLTTLYLSDNQMTGTLSTVIGNLPTSLVNLSLGENQFTGSIPSTISNFSNLSYFSLAGGDLLVGSIPLEITNLSLQTFDFSSTYLCEPADATYTAWTTSVTTYTPGICGYSDADLVIEEVTFFPANPDPGALFYAKVKVRNIGGTSTTASYSNFWVDMYVDRTPVSCEDYGDYTAAIFELNPGYSTYADIMVSGLAEGTYDLTFYVDIDCWITESNETNNPFGPFPFSISSLIFEDDFETGDFSQWTRYNDGSGFLYACTDAALNGTYGACVERGSNNKRKQLIDDTPANETSFSARFSLDINSLSMSNGERFRFMQFKMDQERPAFIVLKYDAGQYYIQLNTLLDGLTKTKTGWYLLTDSVHTIEVNWQQSSSLPGIHDGFAELYIDDVLQQALTGLDNDTIYISSFRMGFTSKLDGRSISGIFHIDDVATGNSGYIGLP
jgi:hypothetical protein